MLPAHTVLMVLLASMGGHLVQGPAQKNSPSGAQATVGQILPDANGLFELVRAEFQKRNRAIVRAKVTELRETVGGAYVVLAWGATADSTFRGNFDDELHGVFLIDPTLTRVDRVLDIMPTPRWGDYRFWIDKLTNEEVIVLGRGDTYGDSPMRLAYVVNPRDYVMARIEASKRVVRLSPSAFRQLPPAVRRRLEADGCQVPQSPDLKSPHNVISGNFAAAVKLIGPFSALSMETHPSDCFGVDSQRAPISIGRCETQARWIWIACVGGSRFGRLLRRRSGQPPKSLN